MDGGEVQARGRWSARMSACPRWRAAKKRDRAAVRPLLPPPRLSSRAGCRSCSFRGPDNKDDDDDHDDDIMITYVDWGRAESAEQKAKTK